MQVSVYSRDAVRKPVIVLIGGAWSAGKSTTAVRLAYRLGMANVIHTDVLRACLRESVKGEERDCLSLASYETWRSQSSVLTAQSLSTGFLHQCKLILPSVRRCLEEAVDYGKDTVVEGLHLHPAIFSAIARRISAIYVWLTYENSRFERQVRSRCSSTYRQRTAVRYLESPRREQILMLNQVLLDAAQRYRVTIIDVMRRSPSAALREMLAKK